MQLKEIIWRSRGAKDRADLLTVLYVSTAERDIPKYCIQYFQLILC